MFGSEPPLLGNLSLEQIHGQRDNFAGPVFPLLSQHILQRYRHLKCKETTTIQMLNNTFISLDTALVGVYNAKRSLIKHTGGIMIDCYGET